MTLMAIGGLMVTAQAGGVHEAGEDLLDGDVDEPRAVSGADYPGHVRKGAVRGWRLGRIAGRPARRRGG